jgi:PAS domain S-box-containing protein
VVYKIRTLVGVKEERKPIDKRAIPALPNGEVLYHRILNEVRDYSIMFLDPDGHILEWNKGAEKIHGYTPAEVFGKKSDMFYTGADRESGLPYQLMKMAAVQGPIDHETLLLRKNGTTFWANILFTPIRDEGGNLIGYSKVTRDLTDRKKVEGDLHNYANELQATNEELQAMNEEFQATNEELHAANEELEAANEALRKSEERYHKMIAEVQDYAIILLDREGNIEDWNTGAEYIKGYTADEIIGKNFRIFYTQSDRDQKLPETLINLAARKGRAQHEGWRVRKDGTKFWGSVTITALHGHHGNILGFTKVTRDLTERKLADDAIKKKNAELEEANKELGVMNKELSSFAYISSHDLQEPLRKIQTFSTRIMELEEDALSEKGHDYFNRIVAAAHRMRLLIDDLLTYSRANNADRKFETVDLSKILYEVLSDLDANIEEKRALIESSPLPVTAVIPFQFHQVFFNLLTNALKFTKPGKNPYILIRSAIIPVERVPGIQKSAAATYYHISVSDNGIGFPPEQSDRIFEVFQRLHSRDEYKGTGIGLAICKKIVENHNGVIRAEGKPGEGATFHIYLPVASTDK